MVVSKGVGTVRASARVSRLLIQDSRGRCFCQNQTIIIARPAEQARSLREGERDLQLGGHFNNDHLGG